MQKIAAVPIGNIFNSPFGKTLGLADLVSIVLSNAVVFAGFILFLLILVGGIMVIAGAGSGNKEGVGKGQKAVTYAVVGFIIIFTAYWIIQIVGRMFGMNNVLTPGITPAP